MKLDKLSQKLKATVRKHYVRKKDFDSLAKEVNKLNKKIAKLEKSLGQDQPATKTAAVKKKSAGKSAAKPKAAATAPGDKLTQIKGIGPVLEKKLRDLGITQFAQIAAWTQDDIDRVSVHLKFKGRIEREAWVQQAKDLG